jgi:hypothetical protein
VNPQPRSGVYGPMETTTPLYPDVHIAGRRVGYDPEAGRDLDGNRIEIVDLTEPEDSPSPSAALAPGGGEAFAAFYRSDYANVARALSYTLGDVDLGREATDEAMARAYARWAKIADYDSPAGWVYRVGLNWAYSTRRRVALVAVRRPRRRGRATGVGSRDRGRAAAPRREVARRRRVPVAP